MVAKVKNFSLIDHSAKAYWYEPRIYILVAKDF